MAKSEQREKFGKSFLLMAVAGITLIFLAMIRDFLMALLMAAILAGLVHPVFTRLKILFRERPRSAAATTVVLSFLVFVLPLIGFAGLLATQAVEVSQATRPFIDRIDEPTEMDALLQQLPFYESWAPYSDQIIAKAGDIAGTAGSFLVAKLADTTRGTAMFVFMLFVTLYAMYFFLLDGRKALDTILYYIPLAAEEEERLVGKFVSVTRATVKGSLVIGIIQGVLTGLALWVAGVKGWAFWGTITVVLSVIPGIGAALVWIPVVIFLFATGRPGTAVGLTLWCGGVVGSIDNLLRPILIGKDTKMPDLLILLSTLGGIAMFGVLGFIVGPIVAALFLVFWDIYGNTFRDVLPEVSDPGELREAMSPEHESQAPGA